MATQIQLRRGTSAEWAVANPVLAQGEVGIDLTLGEMRLGDGVTAWAGLTSIGAVDPADVDAAIAAYLLAHPPAEPEAAWWAAWQAMASGTYLVPDPSNPGLYLPTAGTAMVEDPAHDGLYTIGPLA